MQIWAKINISSGRFIIIEIGNKLMKLEASYSQIIKLSFPIMIGSAAQNIVALSDSIFLYHLSELDFAAIGFVGVFYLVIAGIGFGFTRGGQLMIARRMGEGKISQVGRTFYAMLYFELGLAILMFFFLTFGSEFFLKYFINSPIIRQKSLEYLHYRSFGVFFSYTGVAIIALYTGVARTRFIVIDTFILGIANLILNYLLVFGKWGFPQMGIGGSALASTLSEILAFVIFVIYILLDKKARQYRLFKIPRIPVKLVVQQLKLALPVVAQTIVALGSWFLFVTFIEKLGERPLAITNLIRIVYLILMVPCWGFASGTHTLVSNLIGQNKMDQILPLAWKTAQLSFTVTMLIAIPVCLWPDYILYPLLGSEDMTLFKESATIFKTLLMIIAIYSISTIFYNAISGTGATYFALKVQGFFTGLYLIGVYYIVHFTNGGVAWAWSVEIIYWVIILAVSYWYLRTEHWHAIDV